MTREVKRLLLWMMFDCFLMGSAWTRVLFSYLDYRAGVGSPWWPLMFLAVSLVLLRLVLRGYSQLVALWRWL